MEPRRKLHVQLLLLWVAAAVVALTGTARGVCVVPPKRNHVGILTDFGGVGDGVTPNTGAFAVAIHKLSLLAPNGGAMLVVPKGSFVTGPINLISHFTLYLEKGASIIGIKDERNWPTIPPLPSYGRGRDLPGDRYANLIMGNNLTDVVITGENGIINGQGQEWWTKFKNQQLNYTRGYLIECIFCTNLLISNVTLIDSPSWNIHPVYNSNVTVSGVTILAPVTSPNTDGINPDSSSNVHILDSFVQSGDDCIAIKSGWDEYGNAFNMSSNHIYIKNFTCFSPFSATIALGSEMSGGIESVFAEDITAVNTESAVRIKTAIGRGAFVRDVFVRRLHLDSMKYVFWMTGGYGQHPDDKWDPKAVPVVEGINFRDVVAKNVTIAGKLEGIENAPFTGICISNVTVEIAETVKKKPAWNCTFVEGVSTGVEPLPCPELKDVGKQAKPCPFPENSFSFIYN